MSSSESSALLGKANGDNEAAGRGRRRNGKQPRGGGTHGSGSHETIITVASTSASPPLGPSGRTITLEDHRPGRATTFSLLTSSRDASVERSSSGGGGHEDLTPYQAGSHSHLHALSSSPLRSAVPALSIDPSLTVGAGGAGAQTEAGASGTTTPYRFHDGSGRGYTVLLPGSKDGCNLDHAAMEAESARIAWHVNSAIWLSLSVNVALFVSKTYSAVVSLSLSVAASAVDSFLDLASQAIVWWAERGSRNADTSLYPAGRSRLEPVGLIVCAALMGCAALQLLVESASQLVVGFTHAKHPVVTFDVLTLTILMLTIIGKLGLWLYCAAYAKYSPTLFALAVDHRNDVLSNSVALVAALVAWRWHGAAWSADPIGAIVMSVYIVWNWSSIAAEHIEHIVGRAADPDFIESIRSLAGGFHTELVPDIIRAYHFGARYLVEIEVVLPAGTFKSC
jgi:cation diffusion facilitator family transporter